MSTHTTLTPPPPSMLIVAQARASILDLFRTPTMRTKTLIIYLQWFANAFAYFGLSMNTGDLGGDLFLNFFISGFLGVTSKLFFITQKARSEACESIVLLDYKSD